MARRRRSTQAGNPPRTTLRPDAAIITGAALIALAAILARSPLRALERVTVKVRPAQPAEAPLPQETARTVVASPGEGPSVLPLVAALGKRLLGPAALAAAGFALAAWGVCISWAKRKARQRPPHPDGKDSQG